jgi:hypothetical protein
MTKKRNKNKEGKTKAKEKQVEAARQQQKLLEEQIEQLQIEDKSAGLDRHGNERHNSHVAANNYAGTFIPQSNIIKDCKHGMPRFSTTNNVCLKIMRKFVDEFNCNMNRPGSIVMGCCTHALRVAGDLYPEVWEDSAKMKWIVSRLLANGTQAILDGNNEAARVHASHASYIEQHIAVFLDETRATFNWAKVEELYIADLHTLVSFFRKQIRCSCLDERYQEVKSITKMGMCFYEKCMLVDRKVECNAMLSCTRCGESHYCSKKCQAAHWEKHRPYCDWASGHKSEFEQGMTASQRFDRDKNMMCSSI